MERIVTEDEFAQRLASFKARVESEADEAPPSNPADGVRGCYACNGVGWVRGHDGRYGRCSCVRIVIAADGVPHEFRTVTLANYEERHGQRVAISKAMAFVSTDTGQDLYLCGGVGAGKTRLACAMANGMAARRVGAMFTRVPKLLHQLQPGRDPQDVLDLEKRLFETPVLVLDDIGGRAGHGDRLHATDAVDDLRRNTATERSERSGRATRPSLRSARCRTMTA